MSSHSDSSKDKRIKRLEARVAELEAQREDLNMLLKDMAFLVTYAPKLQEHAVTNNLVKLVERLQPPSTDRS
jgi:uncharacterized coiled-coil protein SlyX